MLDLGIVADAVDDKTSVAESMTMMSLYRFCCVVIKSFCDDYLRSPMDEDVVRIMSKSTKQGYLRVLLSIGCSKREWLSCPTAYHMQFKGKEKVPTVTLEPIYDGSLWIWHAFSELVGRLNDIKVVESSPLTQKIANGEYLSSVEYRINWARRIKPYWLSDSIYPKWAILI